MSSWVNKSEKKLDELAAKIDKEVLQVVEASGIAPEEESKEQPEDSATSASTTNAPAAEEQKSSDWKSKFTGIFKSKKGNAE